MRAKVLTALVVLVGLITCTFISQPLNVSANEYIRVYVDGKEVISKDAPAQIINDRTMLPVRAISEALGLEVVWDEVNRTVHLKSPKVVTPPTPQTNNT
ncbi:MAG: copper amine oxidase N-terminal domain-containing protein, partial [Syntrophomonadaceae bacterium]|nr:copper amine oxidase N-terminal domain-containing protein [Syntrophomonadaceae bacterium]